jgi:hypothetical protein
VKRVAGVEPQVTYTYLSMFILMSFLKDQMKIYFLNFQYLLQMQLLEQLLKYQQLMVEKQKLKYQMVLKVENNLD